MKLKAIEDAMQGVVLLNDRQVTRNCCERTLAGYDLVRIAVVAIDEPIVEEPE